MNKILAAGLLTLAGCATGSAQSLVGYNFTDLTGNLTPSGTTTPVAIGGAEATAPANVNDGSAYAQGLISASSFSRGSNDTADVAIDPPDQYHPTYYAGFSESNFGISQYQGSHSAQPGTSVSNAISIGSYVSFSLSTKAGTAVDISSLKFQIGTSSGSQLSLGLAYSLDGGVTFSTAGIDGGDSGIPSSDYSADPTKPYNNTPDTVTVDLHTIAALQGATGSVVFDLVGINGGGYETVTFGTGNDKEDNIYTQATDDILLSGTVVAASVPEPSTYALLGVGLLSLLVIARRRMIV